MINQFQDFLRCNFQIAEIRQNIYIDVISRVFQNFRLRSFVCARCSHNEKFVKLLQASMIGQFHEFFWKRIYGGFFGI